MTKADAPYTGEGSNALVAQVCVASLGMPPSINHKNRMSRARAITLQHAALRPPSPPIT